MLQKLQAVQNKSAASLSSVGGGEGGEEKKEQDWETFLNANMANLDSRDPNGNTPLLLAVRSKAPLEVVRKMVEGGASVVAANRQRETPLYHASGTVLTYLIGKLKDQLPQVVGTLVGGDKNAQMDAIGTIYSISFAEQRKLIELPDELWIKVVQLLRVDPANITSVQPKEILSPLLVALSNLTIEDKNAATVGAQQGSFAFLFGLACKHPSENIQKYAINVLFSLSRNDKNKEILAAKWFLVLVKLFSSSNQSMRTLVAAILAEMSIGCEEAKNKTVKEIGLSKLALLLKSSSQDQRHEGSRIITSITNSRAETQKAAVKEGLLALLVGIVTDGKSNDVNTRVAALSAMANIITILADKEANMASGFMQENVPQAIIKVLQEWKGEKETEELQLQNLRALVGITKQKLLSADFIEKEGVEALLPLLSIGNKDIQKQALRAINNLSKKYKKRLAAKGQLLDSLQSVITESGSTNLQKVAKHTLSRLQMSHK